jgi:hypothetical protein
MPGYTVSAADSAAGAVRARVTHVSLHTADSATGGNEVTGNGYARVARAPSGFTAASNGKFSPTADIAFVGPVNGNCPFAGLWENSTFLGMAPISSGDTQFNAEGAFLLKATSEFGFQLHSLL